MDNDVVEQAHEIYFNVIVAHGDADAPWTPEQRGELRRALQMLEPLEESGELGPDGVQLMASLCLELGNDEREEHLLRQGLERHPSAAGLHGDLGAALANLERWPSAVAHLSASVILGVDEPDEQWAAACSQLIDTLVEFGDQERAEAIRVWALSVAQDDKARAWLADDDEEDADPEPEGT